MNKGWLRHLDFIFIDVLAVILSLTIALIAKGSFFHDLSMLWPLYFLFPFIHVSLCILTDAYNGILQRGYMKEFTALLRLEFFLASIIIFFYYFMALRTDMPRMIIGLFFCFCFPLTYMLRFIHKFYLRYRYSKVKYCRQIVIIATEDAAREMIEKITASAIRNYQFFGLVIIDRKMTGEKIMNVPVSADKDTLVENIQGQIVDEVFINIPTDSALTLKLAGELLQIGVTVHIYVEDAYQALPNRSIGNVFGYNVLTSTVSPISFRQSLGKRLMDIAGGLAGMTIAILIGIVIGPIIYIKSPGPILYSQIRVGRHGREFKLYKFRSMYVGADKDKEKLAAQNQIKDGLMFKIADDPRIIKGIGHFIRRTSLDEFPQFWNVLKGDMSLVGTRPPTIEEYCRYSPHHKKRLSMLPGITGLWQVSGRSKITDFEEVVRLDTKYIENWSLTLDIKILFQTVINLWRRRDAY